MTEPIGLSRIQDDADGVRLKMGSLWDELGRTGLRRVSGITQEEWLPQLRGRKAVQVYREMSENDAIIGAMLFGIERLLRQLEWRVEPASDNPDDKANAEFVEQCMDDMSHTWDEFISEVLTMIIYGWSWHEIVYKKRVGPWEKTAKTRSKYTDGRIGWRKLPIRSQETLFRWVFDKDGGILGMVQMPPPDYTAIPLSIQRSLLFRTNSVKNNPEGFSMLRRAYRSWYMKKRLEEYEAIGVERDLAGLPVARVPSTYLDAKPGTAEYTLVQNFRKLVQSVRRDENEGLVLPSLFDQDTKQQMFEFELLTSGGSRTFDTNALIQRYEQRMLMTVLADFILVGHEDVGSYSMHTDKRGLFQNALNSIAQSIAEVMNRYAIPRLFEVNSIKPQELPKIVPNDVDPPDITQLGGFMQQLVSAGMQLFPDPELEKFVRDAARLPQLSPEAEAVKEMQARQQQIMDLASQRFDALNLELQAHQGIQQYQQGEMANAQQQQQLAMGPQDPNYDPGDPDGVHAQTQAGEKSKQAQLQTQMLQQKAQQSQQAFKTKQDMEAQRFKDSRQYEKQKFSDSRKSDQERGKSESQNSKTSSRFEMKRANQELTHKEQLHRQTLRHNEIALRDKRKAAEQAAKEKRMKEKIAAKKGQKKK